MSQTDFDSWLAGLSVVEEDHVFTPIGQQSDRMTELLNERSHLLEQPKADENGEAPEAERSLTESYTARRDELDEEIAAQLEQDHPDAPRIRLRGLSDEDIEEIQDEIAQIQVEGKPLDNRKILIETNLRLVARSSVIPKMNGQDVRALRQKLNRGEWARLLDHVTRLMSAEAESIDLPNS